MSRTRARLLWAAATDRTFALAQQDGRGVLQGRCIHCNRKLVLSAEGKPISRATVEHILSRHHGGTDDLENLAVACAGCNSAKGRRLDVRAPDDPTLQRVLQTLRERRRQRWREPLPELDLPPAPGATEAPTGC